jgi:hypothetical protein
MTTNPNTMEDRTSVTDYGAMEEGDAQSIPTQTEGADDDCSERKADVQRAKSYWMGICCKETFFLMLVFYLILKIQGAKFSSIWIIAPFLSVASIILCVLGCAIFCAAPMDEEIFDEEENTYYPPGQVAEKLSRNESECDIEDERHRNNNNQGDYNPPPATTPNIKSPDEPFISLISTTPFNDESMISNSQVSSVQDLNDIFQDHPHEQQSSVVLIPTTATTTAAPLDLLDDTTTINTHSCQDDGIPGPTKSEIDNLD